MNHPTPRTTRMGLVFGAVYLVLVALAVALALLRPGDGDGLSWVPLVLLAAPWSLLGAFFGPSGGGTASALAVAVGVLLNAGVLYWLGSRLGRSGGA